MKTNRFSGIITGMYNSKDTDRVVQILERNGSKLFALAKGVRKPKSRKAHSIDLGNFVSITAIDGYAVPIINEVKLLNEFSPWKTTYEAITSLQLICEIVSFFAQEGNEHTVFFDITNQTLNFDELPEITIALSFFIINILQNSGDLPDLKQSSISNKSIEIEKLSIHPQIVGFINGNENQLAVSLSTRIAKSISFMISNTIADSLKLELSDEEKYIVLNLLLDWVELILEKPLKTRSLLVKENGI